MVPYLETGMQPLFPTVQYLETVCNHIQKRLGRQPSVSTVPYYENGGSNGSLFRNWIATPLSIGSTFRNCLQPYLETFQKATPCSNGSIFRNWWFQSFPIQKLFATPRLNSSILDTGSSNGCLFRNWIANPLSNGSIFKNCLQPYLETFIKATLRFNGSIFRKRWFQWFPIQKLDCNPHFQLFHIQKLVVPRFPIQKLDCNPPFQLFHIQKPFATLFRNVQEGNPPFQRFYMKKLVVPMVPYLETVSNSPLRRFHIQKQVFPVVPYLKTGLQLPFPKVPYLETVGNHIQKRLGRQPPVPTVPYLETCGSNGSLFRNCWQPPIQWFHIQKLVVPMVPYLETVSNCLKLFKTACNPQFQWFLI